MPSSDIEATSPTRTSIENLKDTRMARTASGVKLSYLASSSQSTQPNTGGNPPPSPLVAPMTSHHRPLARERPYARDDYNNSNSNGSNRPASIRSATSFGRPLSRFAQGNHTRHHSNYSNFSTMSETALPWTTKDIGFNAISGVLNDPARRNHDSSRPSKVDIPPVMHASIPSIKKSDFESYLQHVEPAYERYHNNKANQDEIATSHTVLLSNLVVVEDDGLLKSPSAQQRRTARNPYSLPQHVLSSESLLQDDESKTPPRDLPMLENVPPVFFQPDFSLENPHIFDTVCEGADIVGNSGPNPPVSTNSILQEKLSYYLDTVEVHLLHEIENRSSSFFEALSNLQALHQQTIDCVEQIHTIRQKMKKVQEIECKDGLEVIRLQVRKRNLEKLHRVLELVKEVQSAQPMIQILLGQGDYFAALDLIDETRHLLNGHNNDEQIDLSNIKALGNFSSQLDEMQRAVGIMMQHDFLGIILSDLSYQVENLDLELAKKNLLTLAEEPANFQDINLENEHDLSDRLKPSTIGLIRTNILSTTLQGYRERLMVEIKDIVRKRYPKLAAGKTDNNETNNLAKQLKAMPFTAFFQMLLEIFATLIEAIRRASVYHQLLLNIVEGQDQVQLDFISILRKESADIVFAAADLAHVRCGKLIAFRSDQNALLNPTDFYRLSSVIRTFILTCETYCGRTCFGLRGTVLSQQKAFVDHFHMERIKQESQLIENEQWAASEVPSDFQLIVDRLSDGSISSFDDKVTAKTTHNDKATKHLIINGSSYYVVGCTLLILKMFEEYLKCVLNLESMATDIMQKLIELLKLFNSRVCQVILGAGAMRSAGLKNITAKHLALASQSLGVMIELIPKLKECIGRQMSTKHTPLLSEFDRIRKDYKDHQSEIHVKLIAIMNERFNTHVKAMQSIKWDDEKESSGKNANLYMETLVTETVRLHKVLNKYLPAHDLRLIMSQVFFSFTSQLSEEITRTPVKSEKGKARLRRDVEYFTRKLSSLSHVDPPSSAVLEAVDTLVIPTSPPSSPVPSDTAS